MKKGWETTQLSTVAAVQSGAGFPDRYQNQPDGDIPFYKVSDMNLAGNEREMVCENNSITEEARRELGAFLFPQGSTIFPKIGGAIATNKKRLTTRDSCVDNNVMGVIPKPGKINSEFLFYFFLGHDLSEFANEAHLPSIKKTVVEAWPISVPPLPEQQRIVALLDEAFAGLATAKANTERNLQNARALFESQLESVFSQRGEGWVEKNLGDLCQIKTGKKDVNEGNSEGEFPFFTCAAVHTFSDSYSFDTEALLVAGNGNVGQVSYYSGKFEAYQRTYVLFDFKSVTSNYLFRVLDKRLSAAVSKQKLGNTMPYIKMGMLTDFVVPVPPPEEQEIVAKSLSAIADETQRLTSLYERKLAALEELKKSLLHQAFNGEL
jgi:type I restriction enzyme S subunit